MAVTISCKTIAGPPRERKTRAAVAPLPLVDELVKSMTHLIGVLILAESQTGRPFEMLPAGERVFLTTPEGLSDP